MLAIAMVMAGPGGRGAGGRVSRTSGGWSPWDHPPDAGRDRGAGSEVGVGPAAAAHVTDLARLVRVRTHAAHDQREVLPASSRSAKVVETPFIGVPSMSSATPDVSPMPVRKGRRSADTCRPKLSERLFSDRGSRCWMVHLRPDRARAHHSREGSTMVRMSMRRPATVATATAGVLAAALVSVTSPGATAKPPHHQPTSTPVPIATPDGVVSSYLLNARTTNANQVHRVERAVTEAGGTVVQTWPQEIVSSSPTAPRRRSATTSGRGPRLALLGRCDAHRARHRGHAVDARAKRRDVSKRIVRRHARPAREGEQWDMRMIKRRPGPRDHRRQPERAGRRPRQRHRPRPPGPGRQHRHRGLGQLQRRRAPGPLGHRLVPDHQRPRHPRRRHHRRGPQRRRHRRRRAERCGWRRSRSSTTTGHLPEYAVCGLHGPRCTTWTSPTTATVDLFMF